MQKFCCCSVNAVTELAADMMLYKEGPSLSDFGVEIVHQKGSFLGPRSFKGVTNGSKYVRARYSPLIFKISVINLLTLVRGPGES